MRDNCTEPSLVLSGGNKVAVHTTGVVLSVQNVQPEVESGGVRISSQVAEVLHQYKRGVVFLSLERGVLRHAVQYLRPGQGRGIQTVDERGLVGRGNRVTSVGVQLGYVL